MNDKSANPATTLEGAQAENPAAIAPKVSIADFVEYVDYNKVAHVALVTAVTDRPTSGPSYISLVSFGAIDGDEACERQRSVAYSADPTAFNVWRKLRRP